MTCVHCGQASLSRAYPLRFSPEGRRPAVIDLQLCTDCLRLLRREPDIELLPDPVVAD